MAKKFRQILLILGDIFLLYFSLLAALIIGFGENFTWEIFLKHLFPFSLLYLIWLIIFYIFGFYDLDLLKIPFTLYTRILAGLGFSLFLGITFFYLIPFFGITPKTNLLLNVLIFGILTLGWRKFFSSLFASHFQQKVAIIGRNPQAEELISTIEGNPYLGYKFAGFLNPQKDIFEQIRQNTEIDTLILAEEISPNSPLVRNLYRSLPLKLNLLDLSQAFEIISEKIPVSFVNHSWFLENLREKEKGFYDKVKRIIDVILTSIILLLTSPLWPFIIFAIKLDDRGPLFYFQERIGKEKKPFLLIKFRSMRKDAEKGKAIWAKEKDPRVTRVGKILRQTHLDEIPQLFNVLKGDISLIGPRPERPEFVQKLEKKIPHYHLRHLIKPGFTGWAQVRFRYARSVMDSFEKFQYDLYYIKNRSLILDLRILLKTFQLFFRKE